MKFLVSLFIILICLIATLAFCGYTNAERSKYGQWLSGTSTAFVRCYSGGILIYEGESEEKPISEQDSDGYSFVEKDTGKLLDIVYTHRIHYKCKLSFVNGLKRFMVANNDYESWFELSKMSVTGYKIFELTK